jgi:serine/threonine protein kinase
MSWSILKRDLKWVGRYEVVGKLGRGGCGSVYKARDPESGAIVAVKVLKPEVAADARLLKRFEQEFLATRTVTNRHIARALDFGQEGEVPYLVMEFVEGQDLWDRIAAQGRLPEAEALPIIEQVAEALHHAHEQGMIHRDVKPDNILIAAADGDVKLTDFGLAKDLDSDQNLTETSSILGTPNFMAPEQFNDPKKADRRCDVYSLGATLYMAVTGVLPFEAQGYLATMRMKLAGQLIPPRQLVPELSARVATAILRAMSVDPARRPANCLEFVRELTGRLCDRTRRAGSGTRKSTPEERRKAARFPCGIEGSCRPLSGEKRTRWKGKVTDISATGVGLQLYRRFEPGAVLLLALPGVRPNASGGLMARVVRVQQQSARRWFVGCRLAARLSDEELKELRETANTTGIPALIGPVSRAS